MTRVYPRIRNGLMFGVRSGELSLIWESYQPKLHRLRLIHNWLGRSTYFTRAVPASEVKVTSLFPESPSRRPRPLIINSHTITLNEITRHLYNYLHDFYPQVEHLPIGIFLSERDFRQNKKLVTVQHDTVNLHAA